MTLTAKVQWIPEAQNKFTFSFSGKMSVYTEGCKVRCTPRNQTQRPSTHRGAEFVQGAHRVEQTCGDLSRSSENLQAVFVWLDFHLYTGVCLQ